MNPSIVDDGSYANPVRNGSDEYVYPFFNKGDNKSFEMKRPLVVQWDKYKAPEVMARISTLKGDAYHVEESEPNDIGQGLVSFTRTYASVPVTRYEGTSIVYGFQYFFPDDTTIEEVNLSVSARVKYEYFLSPPDPIIAPRVFLLNGAAYRFGNWGTLVDGNEYPAEDSVQEIYKGGIWQRRTVLIKWRDKLPIS